ncbi:MarR family winged helix-turn-helix transcriptional regulator [Agromyces seonyuensis]|uniref:MarR family transcriptional regulator n=1 Tax=Agromyces seonyuensis TaxID=2662446 RepID=A0A6I4NUM5_9MICO|nr:MarR family winged helix-turn-helix transcriptional regulator [Agromyces seonyuensis]MWB98156.1 MarR family transcriptional regulator [Agromyces seonyuensis]
MQREGEHAEIARETDARSILHSLIVVSRRGVADARRVRSSLSVVDQSLLTHLVDHPGTRAVDLAAAFRLNRSTVSRQVGGLVALGLVREADAEGRGRPLELTPAGRREYDAAIALLQADVAAQLDGWTDEEVARFAADLDRFEAAGRPPAEPLGEPE